MPHRYPQEAALRDGRRVLLRPFQQGDGEKLFQFFQRLPESTRRFAWERIDRPELVEMWERNIDYSKVFPLLALDRGEIVADATLHFRDGGPLRRVGRIKWLIASEFQSVGLGSLLLHQFIDTARLHGLRHLTCMLIQDLEPEAIQTLTKMGFDAYTIPGYGTDPDGHPHDMVKMVLEL